MPTTIPLGAPIWADASTPDLAGDLDFYMRLFGFAAFDAGEQFGHYTELCLGSSAASARAVAGIVGSASGASAWGVSFHVEDCVAAAAEAEKLGAAIVGHPMRIGEDLVYASLRDPDGGGFGLFEPLDDHLGFTARDEPGALAWFEYVYDGVPVEAMQFYAELLNWSLDAGDESGGYVGLSTHHRLPGRGLRFGGARAALGPERELGPHWLVCFGTASVELAASKAVDLGGSVAVAPVDDPGGRMAVLASPTGAPFTVMERP